MHELLIAVLIALSAVLGGAQDQKSLEILDSAILELHAEIKQEQKVLKEEVREQSKAERKGRIYVPGMRIGGEA